MYPVAWVVDDAMFHLTPSAFSKQANLLPQYINTNLTTAGHGKPQPIQGSIQRPYPSVYDAARYVPLQICNLYTSC